MTDEELFSDEMTENELQNEDIAGCFETHIREEGLKEIEVETPIDQEKMILY